MHSVFEKNIKDDVRKNTESTRNTSTKVTLGWDEEASIWSSNSSHGRNQVLRSLLSVATVGRVAYVAILLGQ